MDIQTHENLPLCNGGGRPEAASDFDTMLPTSRMGAARAGRTRQIKTLNTLHFFARCMGSIHFPSKQNSVPEDCSEMPGKRDSPLQEVVCFQHALF